MPFDVMGVVEREVLRPVRARSRQFQNGLEKRRIIHPRFQRGHFHFRTVGQLGLRRQHYHAILDCAFVVHINCLAGNARQCKHLHRGMGVLPLKPTSQGTPVLLTTVPQRMVVFL